MKNHGKPVLQLHLSTYFTWGKILGTCFRIIAKSNSNMSEKGFEKNFKTTLDSTITYKVNEHKIMPLKISFK